MLAKMDVFGRFPALVKNKALREALSRKWIKSRTDWLSAEDEKWAVRKTATQILKAVKKKIGENNEQKIIP